MLNEELISKVLGKNCIKVIQENMKENSVEYWEEGESYPEYINKYELAWKTKEWAFEYGYIVETKTVSAKLRSREYGSEVLDECYNTNWQNGKAYDPLCDIKVCEWIIENDEDFK